MGFTTCPYKTFIDNGGTCKLSILLFLFLQANFDDIDLPAFETASASLLEALNQADFLAYSSVFSDYGNGGRSEEYLTDSKGQVKRALDSVGDILGILEVE